MWWGQSLTSLWVVVMSKLVSILKLNALRAGAAALCLGASAMSASAVPVFSENFNGVPLSASGPSTVGQFNVTAGSVDVIGLGFFDFYPGHGYGRYLDLDGSNGQLGQITSSYNFAPGTYTLTFDLGAYTYNHGYITEQTRVTLGDWTTLITPVVDSSVPGHANDPLHSYSFSFSTTGGALIFSAVNPVNPGVGINVGNILDNVAVTAVPEPSTWAMLMLGFAGLGYLGWRTKRKAFVAV